MNQLTFIYNGVMLTGRYILFKGVPMIHGYVRVSTDDQARNDRSSPEDQERMIRAIATLRDSTIDPVIWRDLGVSGAMPLARRPAGEQLVTTLTRGDTVVAAKMDRLFRNTKDALIQSEAWSTNGIDLILIDMGTESVLTSSTGQLYFTMLAAFATFERQRIAERVKDGRSAKKLRGGFIGGQPPIGYKVEGTGSSAILKPDMVEHELLRTVRHLSQFQLSLERIAAIINDRGFRSRSGTRIYPNQIWRLLHRPILIEGPEAIINGGQVYRCYDALNRLRYIGSSKDARTRIKNHAKDPNRSQHLSQDWYASVIKIVIENYQTRQDAQRAETQAHKNEDVFSDMPDEREFSSQLESFRGFWRD